MEEFIKQYLEELAKGYGKYYADDIDAIKFLEKKVLKAYEEMDQNKKNGNKKSKEFLCEDLINKSIKEQDIKNKRKYIIF